jgi:hypothetical protein
MSENSHPVYDCARQVLQRVLDRLNLDSERRANASERSNDNLTQHRQAGHAIGLSSAATILREEMDKLPK